MLKLLARLSSKKQSPPYLVETCSTLKMSVFIDILVTGELGAITRDNWLAIHSEFCELSQNSSAIQGLALAIDIQYYKARIENVYFIVNYLNRRRVQGLIEQLQDMGFNYSFTDLQKDIQRTLTRVKSDELKLKQAVEKYNTAADTKTDTKLDWYRRLGQLAKYQGVANINPSLITVMDFVALEKEFIEYVNAQKKQ